MNDRLIGMRVFAQVVEAKSFSAAADKLGMSKSLASRHVSALERSLSVKLLEPLDTQAQPDRSRSHLLRALRQDRAGSRARRAALDPSPVRTGGSGEGDSCPGVCVRHVLPALTEFYQKYPKIQVKLFCSNRTLDLGDEGFDLGIRVSFTPAPHLVARKLAGNRSVLCASPAYLERHGMPRRIEDLGKHECVLFPALAPKGVWTFRRDGRKYSVRVAAASSKPMTWTRCARPSSPDSESARCRPTWSANALRQGRLVPLLRQFQVAARERIYLVYLPNRSLPSRVRALIDFLTAWFGPVPSWDVGW